MAFGRGTLIVRYTDHTNRAGAPTIYTNYLEAVTSADADTLVQLCEEGDYEVALDYEVTKDGLFDKEGHYRNFFTFSVRNSNCMVFPFDLATGSELHNGAVSEAGFRLDYAGSHYLTVGVKREVLKDAADGLVEDTRFNRAAKDGAEYTDQGIYTITVRNQYTGESTVKRIYVGTDRLLMAHMTTGYSIQELRNMVEQGAKIDEEGNLLQPAAQPGKAPEEPAETPAEEPVETPAEEKPAEEAAFAEPTAETAEEPEAKEETPEGGAVPAAVWIGLASSVLIAGSLAARKKTRRREEGAEDE